MPPKKSSGDSKKTEIKKKEKVIEVSEEFQEIHCGSKNKNFDDIKLNNTLLTYRITLLLGQNIWFEKQKRS